MFVPLMSQALELKMSFQEVIAVLRQGLLGGLKQPTKVMPKKLTAWSQRTRKKTHSPTSTISHMITVIATSN